MKKIFYRDHILIVPTRGLAPTHRLFMQNLMNILPHSKKCDKLQMDQLKQKIPQLCEETKCEIVVVLQTQGDQLILSVSKHPNGPTVRFSVHNIRLMNDLQLAGNFSRKGRALLSFDQTFKSSIKYELVGQMLSLLFSIPEVRFTDKFIDRMMGFYCEGDCQNKIWFRHYAIGEDLMEIGPRFVLELLDIQQQFFEGNLLYQGTVLQQVQTKKREKIKKSEKKMIKLIDELGDQE